MLDNLEVEILTGWAVIVTERQRVTLAYRRRLYLPSAGRVSAH